MYIMFKCEHYDNWIKLLAGLFCSLVFLSIQAVKSFCRAVHLNPGEREVWEEDLSWACDLLAKKQRIQRELAETRQRADKTQGARVEDLENSSVCKDLERVSSYKDIEEDSGGGLAENVNTIPSNYIVMRD